MADLEALESGKFRILAYAPREPEPFGVDADKPAIVLLVDGNKPLVVAASVPFQAGQYDVIRDFARECSDEQLRTFLRAFRQIGGCIEDIRHERRSELRKT